MEELEVNASSSGIGDYYYVFGGTELVGSYFCVEFFLGVKALAVNSILQVSTPPCQPTRCCSFFSYCSHLYLCICCRAFLFGTEIEATAALTIQIPIAVAIAISVRISHLLGAGQYKAAKKGTYFSCVFSVFTGVGNNL